METVRHVGEDVAGNDQTELIIIILTAVFAVVPFVGELGAMAIGLTTLARILSVLGFAANTALSVTDAIEHPEMAPLAIMGILLGGLLGGRGRPKTPREDMDEMSKLRKGISKDIAKGFGKTFARHDDVLQKITKVCK
jgi:chitinase